MPISERLSKLSQRGPLARLAATVAPMLLLAAVLVPVSILMAGENGLVASLTAFAVCLAGVMLSAGLGVFFRGPQAALQELLVGMMFRMGAPLGAALLVNKRFPALEEAGFMWHLVPFFLVGLVMHSLVTVAGLNAAGAGVAGAAGGSAGSAKSDSNVESAAS